MMKPLNRATLFASTIVALALWSATPHAAAATVYPLDAHEMSPLPDEERPSTIAWNETARVHAVLRDDAQRRQAATGPKPDATPAPENEEGATGRPCQVPSSNAAGDVCRPRSSTAVGAARTDYLHPGYGTKMGPRTYLLPLEDSDQLVR